MVRIFIYKQFHTEENVRRPLSYCMYQQQNEPNNYWEGSFGI